MDQKRHSVAPGTPATPEAGHGHTRHRLGRFTFAGIIRCAIGSVRGRKDRPAGGLRDGIVSQGQIKLCRWESRKYHPVIQSDGESFVVNEV